MIKRLKYIFIPVLAVLLMSHNVFAVDMSPNVHPIWANANPTCSFYIPATDVWQNNAFSNNTTNQTYSVSKINCDYPQGLNTVKTYAVYSFRLDNFAYDNSADSGWLASKIASVSGSADWGVVGQEVFAMGSTGWQLDLYLYSTTASNGGTFQIYNPVYANEIMYLKPNERIYFVGASYWQVTTDTDLEYDYTSVLNAISTKLDTSNGHLYGIRNNVNNIHDKVIAIRDTVNGISSKLDNTNEHYQKEEQAADDISDQSPSDIGNSENAATTNLVGALSGFFTTIANAPVTNCLINGDLGNLNIGGIDLCQGKEHFNTLVEFIGFTALFGVVFWASYHLIKKTLALIDWARSK